MKFSIGSKEGILAQIGDVKVVNELQAAHLDDHHCPVMLYCRTMVFAPDDKSWVIVGISDSNIELKGAGTEIIILQVGDYEITTD